MTKQRAYYRKYRKARDRALSRLAIAYPDDYKELLEQEKANEQENEGDTDIITITNTNDVGLRPITAPQHDNQASNNRPYKSNDGGEA